VNLLKTGIQTFFEKVPKPEYKKMGKMMKPIIEDRCGQLFTILTILLIALMFVSFEIFSEFHENRAIKTRVSTMDSFLHSIEKNLERQLYIAGFRAIFLAENEITLTGKYISNITEFFEEAFYNGTVKGVPNNITLGATYTDMINSVNSKGDKINVNISMTNTSIEFKHNDPWNIRFTMISDFIMQDKQGLARWEKRQNISVLLPIEGFEDPMFIKEARALVSRKINRTVYEGNYTDAGDVSNLKDHVNKEYYAANPNAPSFLNRLEGDFDIDINGIESFVYIPNLPSDLQNIGETCIDYLYFGSGGAGTSVMGMQDWFRIDDAHKAKYQV